MVSSPRKHPTAGVSGRPRKQDGLNSNKRARMRRAQQDYRRRQQAAQSAQARRLELLDSTVRQMSALFTDITGTLLRSQQLQSDRNSLEQLCDTLQKFTLLSRNALSDTDHSEKEQDLVCQEEYHIQPQTQTQAAIPEWPLQATQLPTSTGLHTVSTQASRDQATSSLESRLPSGLFTGCSGKMFMSGLLDFPKSREPAEYPK